MPPGNDSQHGLFPHLRAAIAPIPSQVRQCGPQVRATQSQFPRLEMQPGHAQVRPGVSGILLAISGLLFDQGALSATTQTILWCVIFFLASAGASSAYLTVSEIFPLELRAQAISFFFAISQLAGGVAAPTIFGMLIGAGTSRDPLTIGYYVGAAVMVAGGLIAWFFGVNAERKSLEDIATPLSAVVRPLGETGAAPVT